MAALGDDVKKNTAKPGIRNSANLGVYYTVSSLKMV